MNPYVMLGLPKRRHIDPKLDYKDILKAICNCYDMEVELVTRNPTKKNGKIRIRRTEEVAYVRHIYCYYMRETFGKKAGVVWLGDTINTDHSTVIHNYKAFKGKMDVNDTLPPKLKTHHGSPYTREDYTFTSYQILQWLSKKDIILSVSQEK